ncbi:hypothetical protein ACWF82_20410 [Nocardia sp. NPDC055053]
MGRARPRRSFRNGAGGPGFVVGSADDGTADDLADVVAPLRALTPAPAWELVSEMPAELSSCSLSVHVTAPRRVSAG